jgi:tetratricopeptide (TPR) repeat protein
LVGSSLFDQAIAEFEIAYELDPSPYSAGSGWLASLYQGRGADLAATGNITDAVAAYQQALAFNPAQILDLAPLVEAIDAIAASGGITAAVASYQQALALDPTLPITPQVEANRQYAIGVVKQATELARSDEITASLAAISQALQLDPNVPISENTWNYICWNGALADLATQVMAACENAVAADPEDGGIYDSRGLARALTGDVAGAIEDFEFAVQWAKETNYNPEFITEREAWIAVLKAGRNPFDEGTLARLRGP